MEVRPYHIEYAKYTPTMISDWCSPWILSLYCLDYRKSKHSKIGIAVCIIHSRRPKHLHFSKPSMNRKQPTKYQSFMKARENTKLTYPFKSPSTKSS